MHQSRPLVSLVGQPLLQARKTECLEYIDQLIMRIKHRSCNSRDLRDGFYGSPAHRFGQHTQFTNEATWWLKICHIFIF